MRKKLGALLLITAMALATLSGCGQEAAVYPARAINNVIPFGAGGGTDTWSRAVMAEMAVNMDCNITSSNMTGGSAGSIGVNYSWEAAHDGYTLCGTSETPLTIPVQTGLEQTSKDWEFFIAAGSPGILCVNKASAAQDLQGVIDSLSTTPESLSIAGTQGGLWFAQAKLFEAYANLPFKWVAYDGSGTAIKGCYSGETDAVVASAGELLEYIKSGDLIPIAVMDKVDFDFPGFGTVPAVTSLIPELDQYLPLQQFLGFMVPIDTDKDIVATLQDSFHTAMASQSIIDFAASNVATIFNLTGKEASAMAKEQESKLCWILYDMGQTKFSPEDFGIERP